MKDLFNKHREIIMYIIFGVLTTVVSIFSFWFFATYLKMNVLIANIISWICAVSFAYFTNSRFVFTKGEDFKTRFKEMIMFFSGRLATLGIEEVILFIFVTLLHYNEMIVKLCAQIVVLVSNYLISKLIVFRNNVK